MDILNNTKYTTTKLENSEMSIDITISKEYFLQRKAQVLEKEAKSVTLTGFREGKAPLNLVESSLGIKLIEKTFEEVIPEVTSAVLNKEQLMPISQVKYDIKELGITDDNSTGLHFTAIFTKVPDIELPDFKDFKTTLSTDINITDEEITKFKESQKNNEKSSIELTDEEIKAKLIKIKESENLQNYKSAILEELTTIASIDFPESLAKSQLEQSEKDFEEKLKSLGLKMDDYLKSQRTTIEEVRLVWDKQVRANIKVELCLAKLINVYKIEVSNAEIDNELEAIKDQLKSENEILKYREYIRSVKLQQNALEKLLSLIEEARKS